MTEFITAVSSHLNSSTAARLSTRCGPEGARARMPPQTGIGLTLVANVASGALRVTAMDPEGPAAKGGLIMPGDMLYEVDDTRSRCRRRARPRPRPPSLAHTCQQSADD